MSKRAFLKQRQALVGIGWATHTHMYWHPYVTILNPSLQQDIPMTIQHFVGHYEYGCCTCSLTM